jgi:hypothetical protein
VTTLVLHYDKQNKEIIIYNNNNKHFHSSFTHTLLQFTSACMCFFFLNQKSEIIYLLLHICNMYKLSENRKKIYIQALETGKKS